MEKIWKQRVCILWLISILQLGAGSTAVSAETKMIIDCTGGLSSGGDTTVFSGFADYFQKVGATGLAYVVGPCPGFSIDGGDRLTLVGPAEIDGNVKIMNSQGVYFLNMAFTQSPADGLTIEGSYVYLGYSVSTRNQGNGVSVDKASHVLVRGGDYSYNAGWAGGFHVSGHSLLEIDSPDPVTIRGNTQTGIWATQSDLTINGSTVISDSEKGPGIYLVGGSRAQIGNSTGTPNRIEKNSNGGIQVLENSELSLWVCCSNSANVITRNGKFGVLAGFHSQVTLSGADIYENSGPGVDVNTGSQLDFFPGSQNRIDANGYQMPNPSPGVRVSGNSQAWLRGGEISNDSGPLGAGNQSPSMYVGLNSSVDFAGVKLGSAAGTSSVNSNGISCDFTSIASSDVPLNLGTGCILGGRLH